ncbi:MAG: hypothetical protein AAB649_04140 [Patescibacteria group bacterium]
MKKHVRKKANSPTREQIERVIFRTMRIERPGMTRSIAKKAATKVRLAK